jgi:hypothetical protein
VVDDRGGAWFPDDRLPKWDFHDRPFFHGDRLELDVPAVPLSVGCARGTEFATAETTLTPEAGTTAEVELEPARPYEPAARGWYGGDLHVHMNYSGDLVCGPDDAARMQLGEGLHLMNLVAGNISRARVYDREAFEATVGDDLPWSGRDRVARFSVEFRNDLLGHVHVLGLVDSVDLIGPSDVEGTAVLYHHLLSCGLRLAATAGTDVWLSHSRGPLFSNPPGWGRVYADLRGAPLSVAAFADAVRAGRTWPPTGPGAGGRRARAGRPGPGRSRPAAGRDRPGRRPGVERLELVVPDGVLAAAAAEPGGERPRRSTPPSRSTGRCGCARWPAAPATRRSWGRRCSPTPARCGSRSTAGRSAARPAPAGCWTGWTASRPWSASTAGSPTTPSGPI